MSIELTKEEQLISDLALALCCAQMRHGPVVIDVEDTDTGDVTTIVRGEDLVLDAARHLNSKHPELELPTWANSKTIIVGHAGDDYRDPNRPKPELLAEHLPTGLG